MNISISKFIGCVMIVVGSAIGAGILALPIQISGAGFIWSTITILVAWVFMTLTGLMLLETNLAFPVHACSFDSMAAKTLGVPGRIASWIACLLLLCSLVAAYVSGESSLITNLIEFVLHITVPQWFSAIFFTVVLGSAVFWGTNTVDYFNRGLFSIKGILLIATLLLTLPYVNIEHLLSNQDLNRAKYLFAASPIFLHIFNFHFIVPSLRIYVGDKPKELKWIIITGTAFSLIIYLLWVIASLGIVPLTGENSFSTLTQLGHSADTPDFVKIVINIVHNHWVTASINGFYNVSMTTSFLGVSLGLFDFLADGFRRPNSHFGRFQTACLTFIPPVLFALFYPHGFIMALNYAASFIAILSVILPALMVYSLRKNKSLKLPYRAIGNNALFILITIIGAVLFVLPIMTNLNLLPSIK